MSKVVNFRLSDEQQVALRAHAKEQGVSVTEVVTLALSEAGVFGAPPREAESAVEIEPVRDPAPAPERASEPLPAQPVVEKRSKAKLGFCPNHHYAGLGIKCRVCGEKGATS